MMPWIHFHVGNNGMAKACCVANIPFGNINELDFGEIWEGEAIQKLRGKFLKGEKDNRCGQCFKLEAAGGKSIRQETFEKFSDTKIDFVNPSLPIYFDIRFSNVCNFRCRTCWHGASSKWFSDAKKLGRNISEKSIIKNIPDFDSFLEKNEKALLGAEEIYFAGGEPLVTEEHYQLLDWLIINKATHVRLRYNTNFSELKFRNYDVIELWKKFPRVEILASLDGVGALGEYIRKELSWEKFKENRLKIRELSHVLFKVSPTISVYNIRHLPEFYLELLDLKMIEPEDIYFNILERPHHFNIKILPKKYKELVENEFQAFFHILQQRFISNKIKSAFQECLDYMNSEDLSGYWGKFLVENSLLDELRQENISDYLQFDSPDY